MGLDILSQYFEVFREDLYIWTALGRWFVHTCIAFGVLVGGRFGHFAGVDLGIGCICDRHRLPL